MCLASTSSLMALLILLQHLSPDITDVTAAEQCYARTPKHTASTSSPHHHSYLHRSKCQTRRRTAAGEEQEQEQAAGEDLKEEKQAAVVTLQVNQQ